jgi:hypothetical protein
MLSVMRRLLLAGTDLPLSVYLRRVSLSVGRARDRPLQCRLTASLRLLNSGNVDRRSFG